ncbi:hypothetical protein Pse7367_1541 [Thalassoporum mexicanum PCC 7367]|uniref:hypothetical protein n=1 Tax=Thalassoporum mexicanum TaxID=3457544 RepID=UPI00029F878A|nr:hypothetical protein [Pseudanabaena sp. PCC 7367]AFY69830.1 hypothetical protein Pse7367_1541 [Pseudanabaena sp. PCC 7367]
MKYVVAVLSDRIQAEEVYSALESAEFPMRSISILGRGYKTADEFGLIDPKQSAKKQATLMSYWLIPFGFLAGVGFSLTTQLNTFAWAGAIGNHLIGGLLGAIAGSMGSFFVGGGVGLTSGAGDALPYRNRLTEGKYLIIVKGEEAMTRRASSLISGFNPESLQGYSETM